MKVKTTDGLFWDTIKQGVNQILDAESAMTGATNAEAMILRSLGTQYDGICGDQIARIKKSLAKIYEACVDIEYSKETIHTMLMHTAQKKNETSEEEST